MAALSGQRQCFSHSARTVHQRLAASRRGGRKNRTAKASAPVAVKTIVELQQHVGKVLADILLRDNTEKRALAVARLVEVARRLIVEHEVAEWMELIEQRLDAMGKAQ